MLLNRFRHDRSGGVVPIFALAIIPIIGFVGAAVDYSQAASARSAMQAALDATALYLSQEAGSSTPEQLTTKAQDFFKANFNRPEAKGLTVNANYSTTEGGGYRIKLDAAAAVDTHFMNILGHKAMGIGTSTEVVWGMKRLELALVLDNTTSMATQNRMVELKKAAKSLLDTLQKAAQKPDDVKVAIIPYGTDVNVGPSNVSADWLDWSNWMAPPAIMASWLEDSGNKKKWEQTGPGSDCPFESNSHGFKCVSAPGSDSEVSKVPSSGSRQGMICPSRDNGSKSTVMTGLLHDRYYNGCYNSVQQSRQIGTGRDASCGSLQNCACNGSGDTKVCTQTYYAHEWLPRPKTAWNGCVRDRNQDYDAQDANADFAATIEQRLNTENQLENYRKASIPGTSNAFQPHQARNCSGSTDLATVMPLTNDWATLSTKVDSMNTGGSSDTGIRYTNVTIGLAWGWHALFNNEPMTQASAPKPDLDKVIVLMTDGDNTRNRWSATASTIDERTKKTCANVKDAGVKVYTVRVMEGNASLLKACASKADMYFDVENASQLSGIFKQIASDLAKLRVAK